MARNPDAAARAPQPVRSTPDERLYLGVEMLTVGSLFSGIGGLDLGLERAGFRVRWQVEADLWRRQILAAHWPAVRRFARIEEVDLDSLERVDLVAGGFPCRDVSDAGRRAGIEGQQSGLWSYFAAVVRRLRPRFVLVENVPGLLARGMGTVVADLAASGYDAEWDCLPAAAVGAPHLRARIFLLAYPRGERGEAGGHDTVFAGRLQPELRPWWPAEPAVGRVADGLPAWMELAGLGDSVVPRVAEVIGRQIVNAEARS